MSVSPCVSAASGRFIGIPSFGITDVLLGALYFSIEREFEPNLLRSSCYLVNLPFPALLWKSGGSVYSDEDRLGVVNKPCGIHDCTLEHRI